MTSMSPSWGYLALISEPQNSAMKQIPSGMIPTERGSQSISRIHDTHDCSIHGVYKATSNRCSPCCIEVGYITVITHI